MASVILITTVSAAAHFAFATEVNQEGESSRRNQMLLIAWVYFLQALQPLKRTGATTESFASPDCNLLCMHDVNMQR
jgi:hypothetical protein